MHKYMHIVCVENIPKLQDTICLDLKHNFSPSTFTNLHDPILPFIDNIYTNTIYIPSQTRALGIYQTFHALN